MTRTMWPIEDLSDRPDDWLEAFLTLVDEGSERDPDEHFVDSIKAIFRMREIEHREGRSLVACPRSARIEKLKREGKPFPVEREQVYECDEGLFEITRISFKCSWFYSRPAGTDGSWGQRRPLPLPADWRLAGWTR